jgi:hypothetical protein
VLTRRRDSGFRWWRSSSSWERSSLRGFSTRRRPAGCSTAAPEILTKHAQRFPRGVLAEEREALTIDAFVASGRYDEARRRVEGFRSRYPGSLFAPSVAAALAAIP